MISIFQRLNRYVERFSTQSHLAAFFFLLLALSLVFNIFTVVSFPKQLPCQVKSQDNSTDLQYLYGKLEQLKTLEEVVYFLSKPAVNELDFTTLINRSPCSMNTRLLIVVPSHPGNSKRRNALRNRILDFSHKYGIVTALVFFLGIPVANGALDVETQSSVDDENKQNEDMVQCDFEDVPAYLRLKAMSMLRWACTSCKVADYVVRIDDDVDIDLSKVFTKLTNTRKVFINYIIGLKVSNEKPSRIDTGANSTRYISTEEYPEEVFPPYLRGTYQAAPMRSIRLLYQATLRMPPIWLEDVFITGICAVKVDIALVNDEGSGYAHPSTDISSQHKQAT